MDAEAQLQSFIDKFDDDNRALIRGLRAALRVRLPSCAELVWDNHNFLVIGFSNRAAKRLHRLDCSDRVGRKPINH